MTIGLGAETERYVVTPLVKFLTQCDLDYVVRQLQSMDVQWSLSRGTNRKYHAVIYKAGMVKYQATGKPIKDGNEEGPKAVLCRCIARFFIGEQRDFHEIGH